MDNIRKIIGDDCHNNMKKVVIYGNCHTTIIKELLRTSDEFNSNYIILDILPIQNIKDPKYLQNDAFHECDVFIHQSIWKKNRYGEEYASESIIAMLKPGCRVIAIPNVYHLPMCFFPNYSSKLEFCYKNGSTVFFRDSIIDELYRDNVSIRKIEKEYNRIDKFEEKNLKNQYDKFIQTVKKREVDWDIKVADFIDENKAKHRLFYDPNHPANYFFKYVTGKLLELLDIKFDKSKLESASVSKLDIYEMPICTSVKVCFNMVFEDGELRNTGNKVKRGRMFLREYIKQYISMEWQDSSLRIGLRLKSKCRWIVYKMYDRIIRKQKCLINFR